MMTRLHIVILLGMLSVAFVAVPAFAEREDFESESLLSTLDKKVQLAKKDLAQAGTVLEKRSQEFLKLIDTEVEEGFVRLDAFTKELNVQVQALREDLSGVLSQQNIQDLKDYFETLDQEVIDSIHDEMIASLAERLDLAADKMEELEPIFREELQARYELLKHALEQGSEQLDEFEQQSEKLWQDMLTRLEDKLDSEQLEELRAWRGEMQEKIRRAFSEKNEQETGTEKAPE